MSAWLVLLADVGAWGLGFWAWCLEHAVLICVRRVAACCKPSMLQAACRGMRSSIVDEGAWKDATVFAQLATMSSPGNFFQLNASAQGCAFHCARCKGLIMLLPTCSSSGLAGLGAAALLRQPCASQQLFTYCVSPTRWPSSSWACNPSQAQAPCSNPTTSSWDGTIGSMPAVRLSCATADGSFPCGDSEMLGKRLQSSHMPCSCLHLAHTARTCALLPRHACVIAAAFRARGFV